jgi:hypothetical protein
MCGRGYHRHSFAVAAAVRYSLVVADDRTLPPSPARLRRAWRAGLRPRSRWLATALLLCCVALLASAWQPDPDADLVRSWSRALASRGAPSLEVVVDTLIAAGWLALVFAGVAVGARIAIELLTGGLGPIDHSLRSSLRAAPTRAYVMPLCVIAAVVALGVAAQLAPVIAGASRAVDAPAPALAPLLRAWVVGASATGAIALGAAGLLELALDRRRRDRSLYQSHAQAREDRHERGGR